MSSGVLIILIVEAVIGEPSGNRRYCPVRQQVDGLAGPHADHVRAAYEVF
ncbi:hypothetical protein [Streptomyces sp. NPDC056682]